MQENLLTVSQAARRYKKSPQTIYTKIHEGLIYKASTSPILVRDEDLRTCFGSPENQKLRKNKKRKPDLRLVEFTRDPKCIYSTADLRWAYLWGVATMALIFVAIVGFVR